jgi:MYXO-CTERM domain-containing protein
MLALWLAARASAFTVTGGSFTTTITTTPWTTTTPGGSAAGTTGGSAAPHYWTAYHYWTAIDTGYGDADTDADADADADADTDTDTDPPDGGDDTGAGKGDGCGCDSSQPGGRLLLAAAVVGVLVGPRPRRRHGRRQADHLRELRRVRRGLDAGLGLALVVAAGSPRRSKRG